MSELLNLPNDRIFKKNLKFLCMKPQAYLSLFIIGDGLLVKLCLLPHELKIVNQNKWWLSMYKNKIKSLLVFIINRVKKGLIFYKVVPVLFPVREKRF